MELMTLPSPLNTSMLGVFTFLFLAFYYYYYIFLRSKPSHKKKKRPPLAGGAWPIIGHLHLLGGSQPAHITFGNLADKYGPIFTIKLGQYRAIILSKWEITKDCYTTHDLQMLSRPESIVGDLMSYDFAMFSMASYGPYWREMRKLISVELLSSRRLELLKSVRVSEEQMWSRELYEFWDHNSKSSKKVVVEMKEWFGRLTLNTVLRMIAGKRYFRGTGDYDGPEGREEAKRVRRVLREFIYLIGAFLPADYFPILKRFDFRGLQKKMKGISEEMDKLVGEWLKEHQENRKSRKVSGDQDFMDVMISMLEEAEIGAHYDPDTIIKSTCLGLISGGTDTTSVCLTWALALVMNNPQILKKVKEELDLHVGKDRRVTDADIPNLVYLQAIVKETLRLYPSGPLGGPRKMDEDATIAGYDVPKGSRVIFNLWKMHRDASVWTDDPLEFKPERFLTTHKDYQLKGQNFEFLPFATGRRMCPGMHLALLVLHQVLGNLFHAFDLQLPGGRKIDLKESDGLTNDLAGPLELVIAPRLPANLY